MPTIQLIDGFGLNVQATPDPVSAFVKYFRQLPSLAVLQRDLASIQDVPLAGFPLKSSVIGVSLDRPTDLGAAGLQLTVAAGVSGSLCVYTDGNLFDPDPYGDPVAVPERHAYVALGVNANVSAGVDSSLGKLDLGFEAGSTLSLFHYKCFEIAASTPTLRTALAASLSNYTIPAEFDDLASLAVGDIATLECTGTLQFSGKISLLTSVNPLASLSSSVVSDMIQVKAGAAIDVGASVAIDGEFQIRIQKLDAGTVRMGIYRKRGVDFKVQVDPSAGISAGLGGRDFISALFNALSPQPFPSAADFESAGLTEEKSDAIASALKAAVQRRLEIAVEGELQALSSHETAFLYEIELDSLEPEGKLAVQDALKLNLSGLVQPDGSLPRGVREIHSLLTTAREKVYSLKLNLLGVYNYASVNDLALKGTVLTDPASGEIVVTDTVNATRLSAGINYLADTDKLRKLLAQTFLITAAYRCSKLINQAPDLKASYWHFAAVAKTNRKTMASNLEVLEALGLLSAAQQRESLSGFEDFGRSTFYVNTDYDDALTQSLFLRSDGQPRQIEEYEKIGRTALCALIHPGDEDDFRLRPLEDDAIWGQVKDTGGTLGNLALVFPDLSRDSQIPIIAGDYVLIEWWATTMASMAVSLAAAKNFFSQDPPPALDSPERAKVQADLWHRMQDVASKTHDRFAEPWGLIAMDLASGQQAVASAQITSPRLTLRLERPPAAGSTGVRAGRPELQPMIIDAGKGTDFESG
ncbi:MAG: hypothetical protein LAP13_00645 [Acidobacteriia bacterium]|nr:hypothetical protein [Terriglobia bacterium]